VRGVRGVRRMSIRRPLGLALALLALAPAACGVNADSEPHEISRSNMPEGVAGDERATADANAGQGGARARVWFLQDVNGDVRLVARTRPVRRPETPRGVLEALLYEGPTESERAYSITTAISSSTTLASTPELVEDGVLVVNLSDGFYNVVGDDLRNAFAQVVCTVTGIAGVRAAEFENEGDPIPGMDGNGQSSDRPLRCDDYAGLRRGRNPSTTEPDSES
jgi:spore germination protein GerM